MPLSPELSWTGSPAILGAKLQTLVETMEEADRQRVTNDAERVGAMADEAGQTAIFAVTHEAELLEGLPNGFARALWLLMDAPSVLDYAELVRFADGKRNGRMWDGYLCDPGLTVARDSDSLAAFKQSIAQHFGSRNVEVEVCNRSRAKRASAISQLVQTAIYRESRSAERKAFVNGRLDRLLDHPVIEAAITYEAETGILEVVANANETRAALVRLFAEHLLRTPFQGERLRVRQYTLERLRNPFSFPTDPDDGIEGVKVTSLRLMPFDSDGERVTLECMRGSQQTIWRMADRRFGERSPLHEGYSITQARFTIKFRPRLGERGGRTLPVTVSMPKGCDLKDRTEREQLIGDKYLRRWGLLRDV